MSTIYIPFCGRNIGLQKCLLSIGKDARSSCKYNLQTAVDKNWPTCLEEKINHIQDFWTKHNNREEFKIKLNFPKNENNFLSSSLALLLLPITKDKELLFNNICITGDFKKTLANYSTKSIELINQKFLLTAKNFTQMYSKFNEETFAFIYVSNKDEIDEESLKQYPWITVKRFSEGTPILNIINYLKTGICESCESEAKANQFMDTVYQKIHNYLESDLYTTANVIMYITGADHSKYIYDRRLCFSYQRFIQQRKRLNLNINCTKYLDLYDLVSDNIVQNGDIAKKIKPIWQQLLEKKQSHNIEKINEELERINGDILNDICSIKKFIFNKNDKQIQNNFMVYHNQCNSSEIIETKNGKIITPSFYYIELEGANSNKKEVIVYTDSYKLYYQENIKDEVKIQNQKIADLIKFFSQTVKKEDSSESYTKIRNIIIAGKQRGTKAQHIINEVADFCKKNQIQFPTKFVLTGLPGIGKTASLYFIAKKFDLEVVSTEILLNYHIFNDELVKIERFDYEKYWKDIDLHQMYKESKPYYSQYSRKIFEDFSDNVEHMKHIRTLACNIGLELVNGADGKALLDIGGKEAITNFYYTLMQEGFKNILITTEGANEEEIFENYLLLYKKETNLCNESRRNIKKLAIKKKSKYDEEVEIIDTESNTFANSLRTLIFEPRYKYYDIRKNNKIIRKQSDDIYTTVLQILEVLFT